MHEDFNLMLDLMDRCFRDFENGISSKPVFTKMSFGMAYRHKEKIFIRQLFKNLQESKVLLGQLMCYWKMVIARSKRSFIE